tara:strand:- start:208 stop:855 length:648 start_codon:yes stop_codon:yes gene_type:complete
MHLLLKANYKDKSYRGMQLKAGTVLTGRDLIAKELRMSVQQIRTALNKLELTGEVTIESSSQGTKVQLIKYKEYQMPTSEQPASNQPVTNEQPTSNQRVTTNNKDNKEKKEKKYISSNGDKYTEAEILEKYKSLISKWNEIKGTKFKAGPNNLASFKFWFEIYSANEIVDAVKNHDNTFWNEKLDPTFLFRQKNKNGPCDYIGELLQHKPKTNFF